MTFLPPYTYMRGDELVELIKSDAKPHSDYVVIDVRDDDRFGGHIVNSVHSPSYTFQEQVQDLVEKTKDIPKVVFHCALSQARGPKAARIYSELRSELQEKEGKDKDFDVYVLRGGFTEFQLRHRHDTTLIESWDNEVWNNQYF
ncbi:Rhodanese-like protein [Fomitiporia mediterranea MF3/22]|uniref:Rhodanese-like protein n=1 Tax=Fomitiporia mediterranea (strain MF3/22) TaxID=694068 RepID=UPI0004408182|nr:Rhodanese-like protein [Fomitiporia mediterranea MF3/22]EJC97820.1 Rhodanese-like protein [Fomitiporia mediterranea MF3/22]